MRRPESLKRGDKIAILCPASKITEDLSKALEIISNWGLDPVILESVNAQHHQFAGNDNLRANDLQQALDNPDYKAILTGRGGYGSIRIIDQLNFDKFRNKPKWIVGFSDITVIHSHIQKNFQIPTIHGPMAQSFLDATTTSLDSLYKALFGFDTNLNYNYTEFPNQDGAATGVLTGGNLTILQSVIASPSDVDYEKKILFIEDIGESLYNIDRMLYTLKRANKLSKLHGLIIGGFTKLKGSTLSFGQDYREIIMDKVSEYEYPIAFGFPAGHIDDNRALIFGSRVFLEVNNGNIQLRYLN